MTSTNATRIVVVDDDEPLRTALARFLRREGFETEEADSGAQALSLLARFDFDLAIVDVRMPGMSGVELIEQARERQPDMAIIMLTGVADASTAAMCMQLGASNYLTKPVELPDLKREVSLALRRRDTRLQEHEIAHWLKAEIVELNRDLQSERDRLRQITVATLDALVHALEAKDPYQIGHSARVADLSASIATELGLGDDIVESVRTAARLHDIGNIGIREEALGRKGKLSPEEYQHVKEHVSIGFRILSPLSHLGPITLWVKHHHEHWDGSGYPDGLKGDAIPIGARIIGAAEIFDALSTDRPYQDRRSQDSAVEMMSPMAGTIVDPGVFEALKRAVSRRRSLTFLVDDLLG